LGQYFSPIFNADQGPAAEVGREDDMGLFPKGVAFLVRGKEQDLGAFGIPCGPFPPIAVEIGGATGGVPGGLIQDADQEAPSIVIRDIDVEMGHSVASADQFHFPVGSVYRGIFVAAKVVRSPVPPPPPFYFEYLYLEISVGGRPPLIVHRDGLKTVV